MSGVASTSSALVSGVASTSSALASASQPGASSSKSKKASSKQKRAVLPYEQRKGYSEDQVFNNPVIEEFVRLHRGAHSLVWRSLSLTFSRVPFKSTVVRSDLPMDVALKEFVGADNEKQYEGIIVRLPLRLF